MVARENCLNLHSSICQTKKEDGRHINVDGEQLGDEKGMEGGEFNGGRARIKVDGSWRRITETGQYAW